MIPKLLYRSSFIFLLLLIGTNVLSQSIQGHWEGTIEIMGDKLDVQVDFKEGADVPQGVISIPAQNIKDLALQDVHVTPDSAVFGISEIGGDPTFIGTFQSDRQRLEGIFRQYGQEFGFSLKKAEAPAAKTVASLKGLDSVIRTNLSSYRVPGLAVAVVVDDTVVYLKGFGHRDVEEHQSVNPNTLFAIGSSTKAFTTFTLGQLADRGKLEWNQPVRDYIPWFRMSEEYLTNRLTVRDLVTHRSGLPRHDLLWYNNDGYSREELVRSLRYLETNAGLRERFQYNNLMYLTAGYLVEHLTGITWEEQVRQGILDPLSMDRSNFSVRVSKREQNHAKPYREQHDSLIEIPFRDITTVGAAGSINSSAEEMSRWVRLHLNEGRWNDEQIINPALVQDMHRPHMTIDGEDPNPDVSSKSYGLGWFIDTWRGQKRVEHGGNIDGFSALVSLFPDDDVGIVILANKNGSSLPSALSKHIADRVLELEPESWLEQGLKQKNQITSAMEQATEKKEANRMPGTALSHSLSDYAGTYTHPGYGNIRFVFDGDSLYMNYHNIRTSLAHWHYDVFNGHHSEDPVFEEMKMQFESNLDGYIAEVEIPMEQAVEPIEFEKKPAEKWYEPSFLNQFTGTYSMIGTTVRVRQIGGTLRVNIPGQPEGTLVPELGERFSLEDYPSIQVLFEKNEEGKYRMIIDQPQGRFIAEPKED